MVKMNYLSWLFVLVLIILPSLNHASVSVEQSAERLVKVYADGDVIMIECKQTAYDKCELEAKIGNKKRVTEVNFAKEQLTPTLDSIHLDVTDSETLEFGVAIGVECRNRELEVVKEFHPVGLRCILLLEVDSKKVVFKGVVVYPMMSAGVYTDP